MLFRAYHLQDAIKSYILNEPNKGFRGLIMSACEWEQVRYLIALLHPFKIVTLAMSKTSSVTIHKTWYVFQSLLQHLSTKRIQVARKNTSWKKGLCAALDAGKDKLMKYYSKTHGDSAHLYYTATLLDPAVKTIRWQMKDSPDSQPLLWMKEFQSAYQKDYAKYETDDSSAKAPSAFTMDLDSLAQYQESRSRQLPNAPDDIARYLDDSKTDGSLLKVIPFGNTTKPS